MADISLIGVRNEKRPLIRQSSGFQPNEQNWHIFVDFDNIPRR